MILVKLDLKELKEILELQVQPEQQEVKVIKEIKEILVQQARAVMRKLDGNFLSIKYKPQQHCRQVSVKVIV